MVGVTALLVMVHVRLIGAHDVMSEAKEAGRILQPLRWRR